MIFDLYTLDHTGRNLKILSNDYEVFIPSNQLKNMIQHPYKVHLKVESVINYEVLGAIL